MQNKAKDLHNALFAQLERLSDEDVKGDELTEELRRGSAICRVAQQIISLNALSLKAAHSREEGPLNVPLLGE